MKFSKTLFIILALVIIAVIGVFVWQASVRRATDLSNPPATPPFLIGGLTPEQQQGVTDFKQRILARISLSKPLTEEEKVVVSYVIQTQGISYKFSDEERRKIEAALK
ncbi:MAG: hypothetical protein UX89_C0018G0027 [Parcubacteria group bacterium GW2011_GWA2_47_16]|nr:MAG: hypothetical protein UX89_C0018G0027 [Parcubacteria group bacterium GW2011_GWA2_47_16]